MDINIKKNKVEEPSFAEATEGKEKEENAQEDPEEQETENWDMPTSGETREFPISNSQFSNKSENSEFKGSDVSTFRDSRPRISEFAVPIEFSKMLDWWKAAGRWPLILLAALAPLFFLPFTTLPVAANKEILIFALILAALFALLGRILIEGRIRYPGHWLAASLLVLVLVWGVSAFFSVNQIGSLIGFWSTPDSFAAVLLFALLALSIVMTFDRRDIVVSLLVFLASLSVLGLFELLQLMKVFILPLAFSKNIAFNPVGSVNDLGVLLAFGLVIASGIMATPEMSKLLKKLLGISVVILLLNLVIIDFWAIWVGLALAMVFMIGFLSAGLAKFDSDSEQTPTGIRPLDTGVGSLEFAPGLQLVYFQKAWLPSIILLISLLFLFIPSPLAKFIQTPVEVSPNFQATLDIGIANLKAGHYLLGSGPNTFSYIFNLYKPAGINQTIFWSTVFNSGSSAMASWVGTAGIFGVLALLFLIAAFIWTGIAGTAIRNSSKGIMNVASQAVFVGVIFLFAMWFLYVANFTVLTFTFWGMGLFLATSLFFMMESSGKEGFGEKGVFKEYRIFTSPPKTFLFSLLIIGLMIGAVAGVYFEANRYISEIYFSKAVAASSGGNNAEVLSNISRAIKFWPYEERFFQSLSQATFSELNSVLTRKDISQDELRARFQNITSGAISAAKKAGELNPLNPFNRVLLGNIYENLIPYVADASNFALLSYNAAVALEPKNPADRLALARVYLAQSDMAILRNAGRDEIDAGLNNAVSNLEEAIGLKADYAPARFLLVQIFDRQGKLPEAIERAEELVILNNSDVGALFQLAFLYYKAGRFDDSRLVFERTVELSPNYSNARYFLGLIYDRGGDKAKAIEQFVKIGELNPDNAEVKQIIANLAAKKAALFGIAPPAPAPQNRAEAPVSEEARTSVKPLKK